MSNPIYIGIDSGMDGAIVMLEHCGPSSWYAIAIHDMPTFAVGKKGKRDYDIAAIAKLIPSGNVFAGFEVVQANPKFGNVTNASLGRCRGIFEGILAAREIPLYLFRPQDWKKSLMAGMPSEKSASILAAKRLFPQVADQLTLKKHHGRADALLIARYTQICHEGKLR